MFKNEKEWEEAMKEITAASVKELKVFELMGFCLDACDYDEKSVTFCFKEKDYFENQFSNVEGAVISAMMEMACGTLSNGIDGGLTTVITDMQISFIRGLRFTGDVLCKATLVKEGRSLIRTKGEIFDRETGKIAVTASVSSFRK